MGNKGTYNRILDSNGLTERERSALMHYLLGDPDVQFNKIKSIEAAGYQFEGVQPESHKAHEMDRILKKKNVQKLVQDVLEERENAIVWDKLWLLQEVKRFYAKAESETVKKGLLEMMFKTSNLFKDATPAAGTGGNPVASAKRKFDQRVKEARKAAVLAGKTVEFTAKDGTTDES